ncbi:2-oxoacid:acceptor oxidoreductase subunit alpha [bacterium]|nr:2-oxoacid:acceptor oxidoreductase subunit alpha [bacterium]
MTHHDGREPKPGTVFINGDTACAEGALAAGCRFFAGYPITPATEIAEYMASQLPSRGGRFIQMEDEIAAMAAVIGGAWGGARSMTATSGPGFSLMMENLGLAIMTETPCVLTNVQRCGPSTGLPTQVGQGDMMQAKWGSHGDYEIIALSPNSPQEMYDMTAEAFDLADRFRSPVLIMADEIVGHMNEKVILKAIKPQSKVTPIADGRSMLPYTLDPEAVTPMPPLGAGHHVHVTGLTHDERGHPVMSTEVHRHLMEHLTGKILSRREELTDVERVNLDDRDVVLVAYGITSRVALRAIELARENGANAGLLRLKTVWPFPEQVIEELADQVKTILVPEINMGQMVREVQRSVNGRCRVVSLPHTGGAIHDPHNIAQLIEETCRSLRHRIVSLA